MARAPTTTNIKTEDFSNNTSLSSMDNSMLANDSGNFLQINGSPWKGDHSEEEFEDIKPNIEALQRRIVQKHPPISPKPAAPSVAAVEPLLITKDTNEPHPVSMRVVKNNKPVPIQGTSSKSPSPAPVTTLVPEVDPPEEYTDEG